MKQFSSIIQLLHLLLAVLAPLIPILTTKYDLYYITGVFLTVLHWNIFNGECIASYFEKKFMDPKYQLGDTQDSLFKNILGKKTTDIIIELNFIIVLLILYRNYGLKNFRTMAVLIFSSIIIYYSFEKKYITLNK